MLSKESLLPDFRGCGEAEGGNQTLKFGVGAIHCLCPTRTRAKVRAGDGTMWWRLKHPCLPHPEHCQCRCFSSNSQLMKPSIDHKRNTAFPKNTIWLWNSLLERTSLAIHP